MSLSRPVSLLSWVYALTFAVLVGCLSPGLASTGAGWHDLGQGVAKGEKEDLLDGQG